MKQTKAQSFIETCIQTAVGFACAYVTQIVTFPWFGLHVNHTDHLLISAIFTVVSIIRGYFVRRFFNWWHFRRFA